MAAGVAAVAAAAGRHDAGEGRVEGYRTGLVGGGGATGGEAELPEERVREPSSLIRFRKL
jgi:hypothetical protein